MADDRFRAAWRRHFSRTLHPHVPVLQSLAEAAEKLDATRGFLEPLSPDTEAEREQGLVVASLAIDYALKLLEHHALVDGPDPPMPVNLAQAKQAVANLLAVVREYVELGRTAEGHAASDAGAEEPGGADVLPTGEGLSDRDEARLAVGLNTKVKPTTGKAYGIRTFAAVQMALDHNPGALPQSESTHGILLGRPFREATVW